MGVEAHCLDVAYVDLSGYVHLNPYLPGIAYCGNVAGYYCRYAALLDCIDHVMAFRDLIVVDYCVDREIGFHAGFIAYRGYAAQVVEGEVDRRTGAHVESFDTEIYGVGSGIDGGME